MTGLIVILLLVFGFPYIWRILKPYLIRWAQRRAQSYMRKAMGMPPHGRQTRTEEEYFRRRRYYSGRGRRGVSPIIPKEYAEDVEFTEIHTYAASASADTRQKMRFSYESQVSDAEIIEIKKDS